MKKIIAAVLCVTLVLTLCSGASFAEADTTPTAVAGLDSRLAALFIRNNFTEEEINALDEEYMEFFNGFIWPSLLKGKKILGKMETQSDEEEYALELSRATADYDNCVLQTATTTARYAEQYAQAGSFDYLFSDCSYWPIGNWSCTITKDGTFYTLRNPMQNTPELDWQFTIFDEGLALLKNPAPLHEALLARGETEVLDAKLFGMTHYLSFLYLKGAQNEYLVKLYDSMVGGPNGSIPTIISYELYSVTEVLEAIAQLGEKDGFVYNSWLAEEAAITKPTYEAEGNALIEAGLIQGNEKGLDPLKPMSRLEATTILVRALGYEDEPTQPTSQFVDIPDGSWGVKYTNIAADKGITMGVGDGKFAPEQRITSNEFATLVLRSSDAGEFDWQQAVGLLVERGLLTQEQAEKMDLFTRGDMAKIVYEAREKGML